MALAHGWGRQCYLPEAVSLYLLYQGHEWLMLCTGPGAWAGFLSGSKPFSTSLAQGPGCRVSSSSQASLLFSPPRLARGREEWESAALQNANTKCNGLLPVWGPHVPESAFATCLAR